MIVMLLGALVAVFGVYEVTNVEEKERGSVVFYQAGNSLMPSHLETVSVTPDSDYKFRNIVRQAYDYSCGSAALTTLLDYYLGRNFQERHVMEGLLEFGETDKIVERRGFSLLDMKRLVTALGHPAGGFKASVDDLIGLEHPAIVPIEYAGFKHFVVLRGVKDGRVFIADPAIGNISFTLDRFTEVWDRNVVFIVFPGDKKPVNALALKEDDLRYIDESTIPYIEYLNPPKLDVGLNHKASTAMGNVTSYSVIVQDAEGGIEVVSYNLDADISAEELEEINEGATTHTRSYKRNPEGRSRLHFKRN